MKKIVLVLMALVGTLAFAQVNPYADYGHAMASSKESPMAVEWQDRNKDAIAAATAPEVLATHVRDAASAEALLARVKGAYSTDPMDLTVAAAVSQYVMLPETGCPVLRALAFWRTTRADERKVWTAALLKMAETSADEYGRMFALDQLRWCGTPCQAPRLQALAAQAKSRAVADFARWVARDLAR